MDQENTAPTMERLDKFENLKKVTPLSKYLAMVLFIIMPFIGGWIGYTYAPEKVVEVVKYVETEDSNYFISTSSIFATSDPGLGERIEKLKQEIIRTRGTGCTIMISDSVENLVCTDPEAEESFYLDQCLGRGNENYNEDRVLENRYIQYQNNLADDLNTNWELVKDCARHEGKYWDGLYNKKENKIFYLGEAVGDLYGRILSGNVDSPDNGLPLFLVQTWTEKGFLWTELIDIRNPETLSFGKFAKITKLYGSNLDGRKEFEWIGTVLPLGAKIILATEKGIAEYNYKSDSFEIIVPTDRYELARDWGDGGSGKSDSLRRVDSDTFVYQLFDDESNPKGGEILYTIK